MNVVVFKLVWIFYIGVLVKGWEIEGKLMFEVMLLFVDGMLYFSIVIGEVFVLDVVIGM